MNFEITTIQIFDEEDGAYSANLVINDEFLLQVQTFSDKTLFPIYSIPISNEQYWESEENQDNAYEKIDVDKLVNHLRKKGLKESRQYLIENGAEIICRNNIKQYTMRYINENKNK